MCATDPCFSASHIEVDSKNRPSESDRTNFKTRPARPGFSACELFSAVCSEPIIDLNRKVSHLWARCFSTTNLQGLLRLDLLALMHEMTRSTLGISEPHSRKTSGVQAARSLSVMTKAWLCVGEEITQKKTLPTRLRSLHRRTIGFLCLVLMACSQNDNASDC